MHYALMDQFQGGEEGHLDGDKLTGVSRTCHQDRRSILRVRFGDIGQVF